MVMVQELRKALASGPVHLVDLYEQLHPETQEELTQAAATLGVLQFSEQHHEELKDGFTTWMLPRHLTDADIGQNRILEVKEG